MRSSSRRLEDHSGRDIPYPEVGTDKSGMGAVRNNFWQGRAIHLAQLIERLVRPLSVVIPVLAYIWRYSLDSKTKASRERRVGVMRDRFQMEGKR